MRKLMYRYRLVDEADRVDVVEHTKDARLNQGFNINIEITNDTRPDLGFNLPDKATSGYVQILII